MTRRCDWCERRDCISCTVKHVSPKAIKRRGTWAIYCLRCRPDESPVTEPRASIAGLVDEAARHYEECYGGAK